MQLFFIKSYEQTSIILFLKIPNMYTIYTELRIWYYKVFMHILK